MNTKKLLYATTLLFLVLITSCAKDEFVEITGVCPMVVSTYPVTGATNVPFEINVTVTFNEVMNHETINVDSFTLEGTNLVQGTVNGSGLTSTFTPNAPLEPNTTYLARIKSSARDVLGNALQEDYVWTFTTGAIIAPMVIETTPIDNATGVALNQLITATFDMSMDATSINTSSFLLKQGLTPILGSVSYSGTTATFTPNTPLAPNTVYQATIESTVQNLLGNSLQEDYVWTFTTVLPIPPLVIATVPTDNATSVALNQLITATFDMAMDPTSIHATSFLLKHGATVVSGNISYSGTTATFTPNANLLSNTNYIATLTTDVKNSTNTPLANNYVWNFTTIVVPVIPFIDLKSSGDYGILTGLGISNDAGFSEIHDMNVGISPGVRSSITGFPPAIIVNGNMYASDDVAPVGIAAMLTLAKQDMTDAYLFAEGVAFPVPTSVSGDQGGLTLAPGIYKSTSTLLIQNGNLTLDAQGDPNAYWLFQIGSGFTTIGGAGGNVILTGGAQAKNVFWQVGSSATIGDYTIFKGNILALTSITMNSHAVIEGRLLSQNGAVVMTHTNIITKP